MKVVVDRSKCADHGQCIFAAPEVFSWGEDGALAWVEDPGELQREAIEEAVDICPAQAIHIEG